MRICFKNLEECNVTIQDKPKQAFVLMPFDEAFDLVYSNGVKKTLEKLGWTCLRSDERIDIPETICRICKSIQESRLIVADVTGKNPNVFLEIGLAFGLEKEILFLSQNIKDLPFDVRTFHAIPYNPKEFTKLSEKITAYVRNLRTLIPKPRIEEKTEFANKLYGPLYNEIDSFLNRRRKYTKVRIVNFTKIVSDHKYLWDQVDSDLRQETQRFYGMLDEFNRRLDNAPAIINRMINKVVSEYFSTPSGQLRIMVQTNSGGLGPRIADVLLRRTTPEEYILEDRPGDVIIGKTCELESGSERRKISENDFYQCLSKCREIVSNDPYIKWIWKKEVTLSRLANALRKRFMKLLR